VKQDDDTFLKDLKEMKIGKTQYYISLPENYTLEESEGPDFSVFYFYPKDSSARGVFNGGIYIGGYPSEFEPQGEDCRAEKMTSNVFEKSRDWTVYNCSGEYSIQTIVDYKYKDGYEEKIHVFGNSSSKSEINKLLTVFSTLTVKK
jgi:hypothetical protein